MGTTTLEEAVNLWSVSDISEKQSLMRKFLENHGELTSRNDFLGFLIHEFAVDRQWETKSIDIFGPDE